MSGLSGDGRCSRSRPTCCGRRRPRPFTYDGPVYAVAELARALCPWCIADGQAAAMFDAQFTDASWRVPDDVPADVTEVVLRRTPGFVGGSCGTSSVNPKESALAFSAEAGAVSLMSKRSTSQ
ncbi:CbrC family protein [Micromonospora sp. 050-3]|uniref:CbrC family protein n=1 Tax=Micromonospora sp. 050-3 TaxID=2789265 RepID=UPI003979007E